jgi:hypothetical protein
MTEALLILVVLCPTLALACYLIGVRMERRRWRGRGPCEECDGEGAVALGGGAQTYFGPCPACHPEEHDTTEGHQDDG